MEVFGRARVEDLEAICGIISDRIAWMDKVGIRQWNVTDYWGRYPVSYYEKCIRDGEMFVLRSDSGKILAMAAMYSTDIRWPEDVQGSAWYVHHLASAPDEKGAGRRLLIAAESLAREEGKEYLRLDSADDNPYLTSFYNDLGYIPQGHCIDGLYSGICREKRL